MGYCNQDNRGFSLVELIIVVAIISIMLTATFYGIGLVTSKEVGKCTNQIYTTLQNSRITATGKADGMVSTYICKDASGNVVIREEVAGSQTINEVIGKPKLKVSYSVDSGAYQELTDGNEIVIQFDRSTGGLKKTANSNTQYYTEVQITDGNRTKVIHLISLTGKISVE